MQTGRECQWAREQTQCKINQVKHCDASCPYSCVLLWTVLVAQLCPAVCNLMDCSPPVSSVHGILQERTLEWIAIPFPRGTSQPRD